MTYRKYFWITAAGAFIGTTMAMTIALLILYAAIAYWGSVPVEDSLPRMLPRQLGIF
jgi:hypothetical protein